MSAGLKMMMKSFGLDPQEITGQVQQFAGLVVQFNEKLDKVLSQQAAIMAKLEIEPPAPRALENGSAQQEN